MAASGPQIPGAWVCRRRESPARGSSGRSSPRQPRLPGPLNGRPPPGLASPMAWVPHVHATSSTGRRWQAGRPNASYNPNTLVVGAGDRARAQRMMQVAVRVAKLGRKYSFAGLRSLSTRDWLRVQKTSSHAVPKHSHANPVPPRRSFSKQPAVLLRRPAFDPAISNTWCEVPTNGVHRRGVPPASPCRARPPDP